jgi:hypothetical protein
MKNLTLLLFVLLFTQITAYSQPCLPEGITFTTQAKIDNFQTNYPNCTEIEGDVIIGASWWTGITNLNGLSVLTAIGGELSICCNDVLTSLTGLENLTYIGGHLTIGDYWTGGNPSLTSLSGLDNLTSIGGNLEIGYNDSLTSITGLENLSFIEGNLNIGGVYVGNPSLTSLSGLDNLDSIGGTLKIWENAALTSLTGLENLISINGDLIIGTEYFWHSGWHHGGNPSISSLIGLNNLTSIGGNLEIGYNDSLTSLTGLENVASIGNNISIRFNDTLSTCEVESICNYLASPNGTVAIYNNANGCNNPPEVANACGITLPCLPFGNYYFFTQAEIDNFQTNYPNCTEIEGDVEINGDDITNLNGLNILTAIGGELSINGNDALTSLTGLDNVTSIGGELSISGNDALTSLTGLDNVTSIGGGLWIINNDALTSLSGLDNLTSIGGCLRIWENAALMSLTGLENLTFIDVDLQIGHYVPLGSGSGNPSLTSLTGLDNVISIGGSLWIIGNHVLTSLTGLENVTSIGANLIIFDNDAITSLVGLDNIDAASIDDLEIYDNFSLSTCEVQSVCDYLASPGGDIEIHSNAPGCNSQQEVEEACDSIFSIGELNSEEKFTISPNPLESTSLIQYTLHQNSPVTLQILDLNGRVILTLIDIFQRPGDQKVLFKGNGLRPGINFCVLKTIEGIQTRKIVKL